MAGQHLRDLQHRTTGMHTEDVDTAQMAWDQTSSSLQAVGQVLNDAAPRVLQGFGKDSLIGQDASTTFTRAAQRVLDRRGELNEAAVALEEVATAMANAKTAATDAPDEPGTPPRFPTGIGSETDEITALKVYAGQSRIYASRANNFADADEDARVKVEELKKKYAAATDVFAKIHGDPVDEPTGGGPGDGGTGGGYTPAGVGRTPLPGLGQNPDGTHSGPHGPGVTPGEPGVGTLHPGTSEPVDVGPSVSGHQPGHPGGSSGGGGSVFPAVIGGGVAAGVFGTPGVVNGIRNILSGRSPLSGGGTIGSTSRAGGPGSLGRPGVGTGSPVSKAGGRGVGAARGGVGTPGSGGRSAGGRSGSAGGRGVPGTQGGRGTRGGGGAGAGGSGRGRKNNDKAQGQDNELLDDGQDWLDDEGTAPTVLN